MTAIFFNHNTVDHLEVTGGAEVQTQVFNGQKHPHLHLVSKHEWESWWYFGAKAHVHIDKEESRIALITDDTGGFAFLLIFHYSHQNLYCPMIMQSPIYGQTWTRQHGQISLQILHLHVICDCTQILYLHGICDCDTIASTLGDQITAISVTHLW